jgi:hypothetical protein
MRNININTKRVGLKNLKPNQYKNIYMLIAAILAILAVITGIVFFSTKDKNAKDLYFKIETKNFVHFMDEVIKNKNNNIAKTKPLNEKPSRTRYEMSVNLSGFDNDNKSDVIGLNLPKQAVDIINSSKLVLNSRYDLANNIHMDSLSFLLEGQNFLDINTFFDKDTIGLQIPIIYDKYFVFNKNNLAFAFDRFGINIPIRKIITFSEIKDPLKISPLELKSVLSDYIRFLKDIVQEKNISINKNVKLKKEDFPIESEIKSQNKYNIISINMKEDELKDFIKKTINIILSDQRLLNLTLNKAFPVLETLKDAGYFELSKDMENLYGKFEQYEDIEIMLKYLLNIVELSSFPDGINMVLVVDKNNNILDRKISFTNKIEDEPRRLFSLHTGQFFTNLTIEQEQKGNEKNIDTKNSSALIELKMVKQNQTKEKSIHISCVNNVWPDFEALINTRNTFSEDNKKKTINTNYIFDLDLTCSELGIKNSKVLFDLKKEDRYDIEFTLPNISEETAIDIELITEDGLERVKNEIQLQAAKFIFANQYLLNVFSEND